MNKNSDINLLDKRTSKSEAMVYMPFPAIKFKKKMAAPSISK